MMKAQRILRQICLLVAFLMLDADGIFRLTEGKTLPKADQPKAGTAPSVFIEPKHKTVREGKGLSLSCAVTGKPKPRIKWKKNGKTITSDNRIRIRFTDTGSKLRIRNATIQDSGMYHCVAKLKNHHSTSEKAVVQVIVGTCEPYTGSVCSSYILKDTRVLISPLTTQRQSEDNIVLAASTLTDFIDPTCRKSLLKALCYNHFQPCPSSKQVRPMQLCKDECEVLQARTCSKEFRLLRERLGSSLAEEIIPNCARLARDCDEGNKTVPGRDSCQKDIADVSQAVIKPMRRNYPVCSERLNRKFKIYNREVFHLVKNIKSELQNGGMALTSHSSELSTYCFSAAVPLSKLVRDWITYFSTPLLPNFQRPHDLTVPGLKISTLNSSVSSILIPLGTSAKYKVHEKISLRNATFYYRFQSGRGSFIAEGEYNLCETVFRLTVETLHDGTTKLSGFSETPLDVNNIETDFVSARSPNMNMLVDAIKDTNLFVLRLMKPSMEAYISKDLMVKFSGMSYFGPSALPVTLEFFGGKLHRQDVLLVGITSTHVTINQALKLLFRRFTLPFLDITKHSPNGSSIGIILSAHALDLSKTPYGRFQQQPLSLAFQDKIPMGLSLVTKASVPVETHNISQVCQLFQAIFGRGSDYTLKASTNWEHFTLDWHFHRLSNVAVTSFDSLQMKIEINDTSQPYVDFPVDGTFYKSGQQSSGVPFTGQLTYDGSSSRLQGDFRTQSAWRNAFGIEYLAMSNLRLGLSLPTDQSQKSSIRGEADLKLGSGCNAAPNGENDSIKKNCVTGHLYLGFSDESADHFFYGTLAPVSLQKLLEVCNVKHKLPGAMATIGFPDGLQISVAKGAHDLRSLGGPNLKPGFILAGKMSVLGIETTGAISLLPREFLIDSKIMSDEAPATLDDVTPLFLSRSDPEETPKVFLQARMDPVPFVKVDGYARLFGIFKEVRMLVTSDSLQMYLTTEVNKSFKINVHVTTNYSSDRNETQFNATVVFDNGLSKLTRLASKQVVSMLESEMSKLKSAKGEVQRLRRECVKAIKRECSSCMSHGACASSLSSVDPNKALKSSTNTSEKKRDAKRPGSTMDICHQLVVDRCLATETAPLNICRFISSKLNKTCAAHETAAKSQRELERGLRWVKQAEQFMYSDLFQIHAISFKTNVTSANLEQIYLDTVLEVTIFGQKQRLDGLRMDFNEFVKLSSEIAKYAIDWYQKTQPQSKSKSRHPDNRPRQ